MQQIIIAPKFKNYNMYKSVASDALLDISIKSSVIRQD